MLAGQPIERKHSDHPYSYSWQFRFLVKPTYFANARLVHTTLYTRFSNQHDTLPRHMHVSASVELLHAAALDRSANQQRAHSVEHNMTSHALPTADTCATADINDQLLGYVRDYGHTLQLRVRVMKTCAEPLDNLCRQSMPEKPFFIMTYHSERPTCSFPSRPPTTQRA